MVSQAALQQLDGGWNVDLKFGADRDLLQRAFQSNMKVVPVAGVGFETIVTDVDGSNPWHVWYSMQHKRKDSDAAGGVYYWNFQS